MAIDVNRKIGGLKLKWWALLIVGAIIVGLWWRSHNANQVPSDATKVAQPRRGPRGRPGRPGRNRKGKNRSKGRYLVG